MNRVNVEMLRTGLYYTLGANVRWAWDEAPERIRKLYRSRPDFWAVAPWCIARQYLRN